MKNYIKNILCAAAIVFSLNSCDDATDIFPTDQIAAEDALSSPSSIELAFNGAMQSYSPYNEVLFSSIFTDETRLGDDNGGQNTGLHNLVLIPSTGEPTSIFATMYNTINRATRVIEAIEALDTNNLSEEDANTMNNIKGQALILRSLAHFDALQYFSPDYDANTIGVPYIDYVVTTELPARNTVGEVYAGILSDLTVAEELITNDVSKYYLSVDALKALKSRMFVYAGGDNYYQEAIDIADELIASYPLANQEEYVAMFADTDDTEVIFSLARTVTDTPPGLIWYFTGTGGAKWEMSEGLYTELDDDDIRTSVLLDTEETGAGIDPVSNPPSTLYIGKYPGKQGFYGLNDYKIFRISEQYLLKSEAQAHLGDLEGARQTLKELRIARYNNPDVVTPSFNSLEEAIENIIAERRIELAYEGFRYIDLKRTRSIRNAGMQRYFEDCGGGVPCELIISDHRWTLPIPQVEMEANSNMTQNEGY